MIKTFCQDFFFFSELRMAKRAEGFTLSCMIQNTGERKKIYIFMSRFWVGFYSPDIGWFGLQVAPALVHVIQSVLEKHSFLWATQSLDHLRLVSIHTLVDVIVGIDLSLDVLQTHGQRPIFTGEHFFRESFCANEQSRTAEVSLYHIYQKLDVTVFFAVTADYSWTENNIGFCRKHQSWGNSRYTAHNISRGAEVYYFMKPPQGTFWLFVKMRS